MKTALTCLAICAGLSVSSVEAGTLSYTAILTGDQEPTPVATGATGVGSVTIDTYAETYSATLDVTGVSLLDLFDPLVVSPVGPVHLHNAPVGVNGPIAIAFPFWPTIYSATTDGFSLSVTDQSFADAVALSGSALAFEDFLAELNSGNIYFNLHTDFAPGGELRGVLTAAPVPLGATNALLFTAFGGLGLMRMRARQRKDGSSALQTA